MATTLAACDRIFAAAKQAGTVFMLAENAQYWPEIVKAQELIEQGAIGDVITARAAFFMPLDPYWFPGDNPWRLNREMTGGGMTIDGGSHWLRPLRMWLGEVDEVVAVLDHPVAQMQGESHVRSLMRFRSGKFATYDGLQVDYEGVMAPEPWWRVTGTRGELLIEGGTEGAARSTSTTAITRKANSFRSRSATRNPSARSWPTSPQPCLMASPWRPARKSRSASYAWP